MGKCWLFISFYTAIFTLGLQDKSSIINQATVKDTLHLLMPDFFVYSSYYNKDTLFEYRCYDDNDSLIRKTELSDFSAVEYTSYIENYTDSAQTYKDGNQEKPLNITKILCRYDKVSAGKWMRIDYRTKQYNELKESRENVVRRDTLLSADKTIICSYYKTIVR